jgi:thiol-disulfide isomerase/thioredoxin
MTGNSPQSTATPPSAPNAGARVRNFLIALVAIALSVLLFQGLRTEVPSLTLDAQATASIPLEVALSNGKPTLMEFYANWCNSCQAMAKDLGKLKQEYGDRVNFTMLNVDNTKWLPEILRYRVDGIPHFVYFDNQGQTLAQTIGEQPHPILQANLESLIAGLPLPYAQSTGQISNFSPPIAPNQNSPTDPRSHSNQVKS